MAEKIVSPGTFVEEKDSSFLPVGISQIGAAIVGPTIKGPAFVPTIVESPSEFEEIFGTTNEKMYTPYTVRNYLKYAGRATVIRILGLGGYSLVDPVAITMDEKLCTILAPTQVDPDAEFDVSTAVGSGSEFIFTLSGSSGVTASFVSTDSNYLAKLYGSDPQGSTNVYTYLNFKNYQTANSGSVVHATSSFTAQPMVFNSDYSTASTPWIQSQDIAGTNKNLFQVITLSHGTNSNYMYKVMISDIKRAGTVAGSDYGTFTLTLRGIYNKFDSADSDRFPDVKEIYTNLSLDVNNANFIGRAIGDRYDTIDSTGKITSHNDYPNKSKRIRIEMSSDLANGALDESIIPFGFAALNTPVGGDLASLVPSASFVTEQTLNSQYNSKVCYGFSFDFSGTDNENYLNPTPSGSTTGNNIAFSLDNMYGHPSSSYTSSLSGSTALTEQLKFVVPFQGGFDGWNPAIPKYVGGDIVAGNSMGFDFTTYQSSGSVAYWRALDALQNADEYDINMLILPGVISSLHSNVTNHAIDVIGERNDVFFIMDTCGLDDSITTVAAESALYDNSYVATYYPWCKIKDYNINKNIWVPPSVVLPGVIAYNDKVAFEWFAPAGLNRGGLTNVIEVRNRLTHSDRNDLYEARVNPIATFPGQGISVWGQKTLQAKPSALDRVNVRRLLIKAKKYIASASRYLIFEPNVNATRNAFLAIANPFFEQIQSKSGLYAFRVVMDETNNTPDIIDQNILYGQIWIKPSRAVEFIKIDFNVTPTNAVFSE